MATRGSYVHNSKGKFGGILKILDYGTAIFLKILMVF